MRREMFAGRQLNFSSTLQVRRRRRRRLEFSGRLIQFELFV